MSEATALVQLQEIDLRLLRLKVELDSMPQQKKLQTIKAALKKVSSELTKIVGQRKDAQTDIDDLETDLANYLEKTSEVKRTAEERSANYRQIKDLEAQLSHLAKRVEKCEFELVQARQRLERVKLAERNALAVESRLKDEQAAQSASLERETAEMRDEAVALVAERRKLVADINEGTLAVYDKARTRFKGLAVERLVGNVPSICCVKLQPRLYTQLTKGPAIAECPYCHRILIVSEEEVEGEE